MTVGSEVVTSAQPLSVVPVVSVGLAVFNGEPFLGQAIESILAQTFEDFELIICDNASTDRTAEICLQFARIAPRIRYFRNATNIGGARNEALTFTYARGKYFLWAAHDDVLHPELLERCVAVLEQRPDVVLCHSEVTIIDANGDELGRISRKADDLPKWKAFARLTDLDHDCEQIYGVMRTDILAMTGPRRSYTDSDRTLLAHMSLLGNYYEVPEPLFSRRVHPAASTSVYPEWRDRMRWFGEDFETKITLPFWSQLAHYLQVIGGSPVTLRTKLQCYAYMLVWITKYRRWRSLGKDLLLAARALLRRRRPG